MVQGWFYCCLGFEFKGEGRYTFSFFLMFQQIRNSHRGGITWLYKPPRVVPVRKSLCAWWPPCSVCIGRTELNAGIWDQLNMMNISRWCWLEGRQGCKSTSGATGQEENEQCHRRSNLSNKLIGKYVGFWGGIFCFLNKLFFWFAFVCTFCTYASWSRGHLSSQLFSFDSCTDLATACP